MKSRFGVLRAIALGLSMVPLCATAAQVVDVHRLSVSRANKAVSALGVSGKPSRLARDMGILPLERRASLAPTRTFKDRLGLYSRYDQRFRDLPVYGKSVVVTEAPDGTVKSIFGSIATGLERDVSDVSFRISAQAAASSAETRARAAGLHGTARPTKAIYLTRDQKAHVAYIVTVASPLREAVFVIDGKSGALLDKWDATQNVAIGTGPGGNTKTGRRKYGADLPYLDVTRTWAFCSLRNDAVSTINNVNTSIDSVYKIPFSYLCPQNDYKSTNGAFSPLNDAHYGGTVTYAMYRAYLGIPPVNFTMPLRVHYGPRSTAAEPYANARWSQEYMDVAFGDGNATSYPWTSLDVVAHEIGHAYTAFTSNLVYKPTMSGGLNESFSDMSGEAAEYYATGKSTLMFGEEVTKGPSPLRYMARPSLIGDSIDSASDFHEGMDPHNSSGVYNRAFSLLSRLPGWDVEKAFKVFARANQLYWTAESTFDQAACGAEHAAGDLAYTVADVTSALDQVGVHCAPNLRWDSALTGVFSSAWAGLGAPAPLLSDGDKVVETAAEPETGYIALDSFATRYHHSGKYYFEVTIEKQRAATVFPYSGGNCLSLRAKARVLEGGCAVIDDWAITWFTDADSSPVAVNHPWLYSSQSLLYANEPGNPLENWLIKEGDTIGVAVDLDRGMIWYSLNGAWIGDPVAGTGAVFQEAMWEDKFRLSGKEVVPGFHSEFQNLKVRIRGSSGDFLAKTGTSAYPTGFLPWGQPDP